MKFAILFYAVFTLIGSVDNKEVISWGLTFPNHEECIRFYNQNKEKLIAGVVPNSCINLFTNIGIVFGFTTATAHCRCVSKLGVVNKYALGELGSLVINNTKTNHFIVSLHTVVHLCKG